MPDEWVEDASRRFDKLAHLIDADSVKHLLKIYTLEDNPSKRWELKNEVESFLGAYESRFWGYERPVVAPPKGLTGELSLGTVVVGDEEAGECRIPINSLTRHCIICAQSGHGKSTIVFNFLDQFSKYKVPITYFDLKGDGRKLHRQLRGLVAIGWRNFLWNPLRNPPGMSLKDYLSAFAQVSGRVWGTFHAGPNYLLEHLDQLLEKFERTKQLPTMMDLYDSIINTDERSKKRTEYYDVIYNRMRTLISTLAPTFRCRVGIPLEELLKHQVCLELSNLRSEEQNWMVEIILMWIYHYRLVQRHRGEQLRHVIILDECHRWFYGGKEYSETTHEMGMPPIDTYPTQFRDFGEGLICTTNMPSQVSRSLQSNTLIKLSGNLGSGYDTTAVSEAMGLDEEQRKIIHKLKRAEWIVKLSDYYTAEPFMIVTPDHPVDTDVSDEEVQDRFRKLIPIEEETAATKLEPRSAEPVLPHISEEARALLLDVNNHPFRGISKRCAILGFSGHTGELAKTELTQKNIVSEVDVRISQYRPTKFLVPTEIGLKLLSGMHQTTQLWSYIGHVSFEHRLYEVLASYKLQRAGYQIKMEYDIGDGRRLDLYATRQNVRLGVEIALNSNMNFRKILASLKDLDELDIICKSRHVATEIETWCDRILYPDVRKKVRVLLFNQFLKDR